MPTPPSCPAEPSLPDPGLLICIESFTIQRGQMVRVPNFYYQASGQVLTGGQTGGWARWTESASQLAPPGHVLDAVPAALPELLPLCVFLVLRRSSRALSTSTPGRAPSCRPPWPPSPGPPKSGTSCRGEPQPDADPPTLLLGACARPPASLLPTPAPSTAALLAACPHDTPTPWRMMPAAGLTLSSPPTWPWPCSACPTPPRRCSTSPPTPSQRCSTHPTSQVRRGGAQGIFTNCWPGTAGRHTRACT